VSIAREVPTLTTHKRQDMLVYFLPLLEVVSPSPDTTPRIRTYLILMDSAGSSGEWASDTSCAPVSIS
jgi:hypothetical protein